MASTEKIIAIVGATGNQGSSVAHTFLSTPGWHVRCLTRNSTSSAAQALSSLGAEVVQADLSNPVSLSKAFFNANAIFVNTDFWGPLSQASDSAEEKDSAWQLAFDTEVSQGKNAVNAAAGIPSLERFIYSALPGVAKESGGKYSSYHLDSKRIVADYILDHPVLSKKASFVYLAAYITNAILSPKFVNDGFQFVLPLGKEVRVPIIDPKTSTGPFVLALLEEEIGTKLLAYDDYLSFGEVAEIWSRISGQPAGYMEVSMDTLLAQGVPKDLLSGFEAIGEFGYMGSLKHIEPNQLKKQVQTKSFENWLKEQNWNETLEKIKSGNGGMRKET